MRRRLSVYWPYMIPAVVLIGVSVAAVRTIRLPEKARDNCPTTGAVAHDAVLADASDRLLASQLGRASALVEGIARQSGLERRFSLFRLGGGTEEDLVTEFSGCSPADTPLVGSNIAEQRRASFMKDGSAFIDGMVDEERPTTPLFAATEMLRLRPEIRSGTTRLTVVSDFIEHGERFSHYPGAWNYRAPDPEDLPEVSSFGGHFAEVRLVLVQRPGKAGIQTEALLAFWVAHFERLADRVTVETL